ncbi:hypothetical protein K440DRAFT_667276 [Wilcoxina mikolae CBS 423.85]|nr:hypothetical protein K440DRAFT_667276 [Wilcoxina mikolae CBS 423.85]
MRLAFATITVTTFAHCSSALPVELEPSWTPEPKGRGTLGILFSCVITLALCVWTAIHLNVIPEPTKGRIFAYKLGWVLMGMFTPEIVLWCSLAQRSEAKVVRDKLMEIRRRRWNLPVAFFVVMGGYVVRPNGFEGHPVTLTPRGFVILYNKGFIKDEELDPSRITDKTKADGFAKLVVCVQAFWLVIQGAGRLASRLPLPLLELHTIMHVLCAVPMYWFWWDKPMDVRFPIILDLEQPLAEEIYSSYKFPDDGRQLPPESLPEPPPTEDTTENIEHTRMIQPKGNFRGRIEDEDGDPSLDTFIYLGLLSILYGGAHCGAWNSHLPTPVERILWRCSAVIAGLYVPIFLILIFIGGVLEASTEDLVFKRNEYIKNFVKHMIRLALAIVYIIGILYVGVGLLVFILARLYLIVESFLSLRSLRKGSFETVPWSNYWPHF